MKLYDLGKNHCDYFNQFIPNPAQPEPKPDEESRDEGVGSEKQNDQIQNTGSIIASTGKYTIHCLTVIGQIEGHYLQPSNTKTTKYEHVLPQLVAIEEEPRIDGLLVLLNTVGGDVEAGLAIAELLAGMKKPTGFHGAGRRTLHRGAPGGGGEKILYRQVSVYDNPSGSDERPGAGSSPNAGILSADAGPDYQLCGRKLQHHSGALLRAFYEYRGAGDGCGHCFGWRRRGEGGADRPAGKFVGRAPVPLRHDR